MGDTARVQLYQMPEGSWGVVPATALKELRYTGESLKVQPSFTKSKEIRQDRRITDLVRTMIEAQGGFNFELSYGSFDDLLEGAFCSTWGSLLTLTGVTISAAAADNSFNFSANNAPAFVVGQWVKVAGFVTPANNGFFKVVSRTVSKVVVSTGTNLVVEAAGPSVTINGTMMRDGTTKKSFVMEKSFADITQFISYTGMRVAQFNLALATGEIATGDFQFMGKSGARAGVTVGTGAPVAANSNDVMNCINNVGFLYENNVALTGTFARSFRLGLNNALRGKPGIGVLGNTDIGLGTINLTGQLSVYFEQGTYYDKLLNNTDSSYATRMTDSAGNTLILTVPKIEYTDGNVVAGAQDQDVMADLSWEAKMDPVSGCMFQLDRFAGP
jgi:hypothetical protein